MRKVLVDRKNHNRAILTDTLPYEVPLFFTNEPFYFWLSDSALRDSFPAHLSQLLLRKTPTKPFAYRVRKTGGGHRKLAVPHPAAQARFAEFYRDFDAFIVNVCSRSPYSMRYPSRVGSHFFQSQFASSLDSARSIDSEPASFRSQRKWASSYFYYQRFTHIHKFFASQDFLRLEQRFSFMLKLDVARCFESIYTHSVAWAIRGKDFGKENKQRRFFESEFDSRMQAANWGETNGILIGPEFSRIFAESIMQAIDVELRARLKDDIGGIEIARYVDDYFLFSNCRELLAKTQTLLDEIASKYNLHFNPAKTELTPRPFVSPFTVARQRVKKVLANLLNIARANISDENPKERFSARASDKTLAEIRRIASEHNVDYSTLASPALAVLASGTTQIRKRIAKVFPPNIKPRIELINGALLRIATFFYLMDIRAATSDKLAKIFFECSRLNEKSSSGRRAFEGLIQDSTRLALEQARLSSISGPEIVNILVATDAVCSQFRGVSEDALRSALGVTSNWKSRCTEFNYFDLVAVLYFSKKRHSFRHAMDAACSEIERRISDRGSKLGDHAEETMLFFDFVSCPHIPEVRRLKLFSGVSAALGSSQDTTVLLQNFQKVSRSLSFVAWEGAKNFQAMLARRELQPAYDS